MEDKVRLLYILCLLSLFIYCDVDCVRAEVKFPHCSTVIDQKGKSIITCEEPPTSPGADNGISFDTPNVMFDVPSYTRSQGSIHNYSKPSFKPGSLQHPSSYWEPILTPVRALILPEEQPPRDVAAYGIVAFTARPLAQEKPRYNAVCDAYKSVLIAQAEAQNIPIKDQMITFWPVLRRPDGSDSDPDCEFLVTNYDLKAGLDAIRDADKDKAYFAQRRGPFLVAWSPSSSRTNPDAVILVIDMSDLESAESFRDTFKAWRQKIIDDPKFWRNGFSWEQVRLALRDVLDHYGESLLPFLSKKP